MGVHGSTLAGLGGALFPRTRQRVLGLLYSQPARSFYANEIVRHAGVGTGAVHRELERLSRAGLLKAWRVGNQKHYQANTDGPVFQELRGLVVKTFGVADVLRSALTPFAAQISLAFIYGSVAEGTDTADSDIDVLIVAQELAYPQIIPALTQAEGELARPINPALYRVEELTCKLEAGNAFLQRVLAQPKIFLMGSDDDLPQSRQPRRNR